MTTHEAAILTAYTGITLCPFDKFHAYAENLLGREIDADEFGTNRLMVILKIQSASDVKKLLLNIWS